MTGLSKLSLLSKFDKRRMDLGKARIDHSVRNIRPRGVPRLLNKLSIPTL